MNKMGLPQISIGRYRLLFERDSGQPVTGYQGSAWRGALGHALKQTLCVYLIHALHRAGREGLGPRRIPHILIEVQQALGLSDTW